MVVKLGIMGKIFEELKNCACVWLISICIIN